MTADLFAPEGIDSAVASLEKDLLAPGGPKVEAVLRQVRMLADYVSVNDEWDNAVPGGVRELVDLFAKYEASRKRKRRAKR